MNGHLGGDFLKGEAAAQLERRSCGGVFKGGLGNVNHAVAVALQRKRRLQPLERIAKALPQLGLAHVQLTASVDFSGPRLQFRRELKGDRRRAVGVLLTVVLRSLNIELSRYHGLLAGSFRRGLEPH